VKFKKDDEGKLVLDDAGDPIAISESGEVIPLDKVVSLGKHERVASERDEYKTEVENLRKQIDDLSAKGGSVEEMQKQIDDLKAKAEADKTDFEKRLSDKDVEFAARSKEHAIETALVGAGIPNERLKAAKALIDTEKVELSNGQLTGLDLESFKKDNGYLFDAGKKVASAAPASGVSTEDLEKLDMDAYVEARSKSDK
jgi:hypothetical protein